MKKQQILLFSLLKPSSSMNYLFLLFLASLFLHTSATASLALSQEIIGPIAERIWQNECGGKTEALTHWGKGENCASFGIGHFIWYSKGKEDRFEETFPSLLEFLQKEGVVLPAWLKNAKGCPWHSRDNFYQNIDSREMISLRKLLLDTKNLQALYITQSFEMKFSEIMASLPPDQKERVSSVFHRLSKDPQGLYALIDYCNCKGSGLVPSETYQGKGWGLTQVLLQLSPSSKTLLADFVDAAKKVLTERVHNSPPERNEERWLKGWHNRINTYLEVK